MITQPVSSIFPCSPLPSGTWWTPGLPIPRCCLPTSSSVCLVFFSFFLFWWQTFQGLTSRYILIITFSLPDLFCMLIIFFLVQAAHCVLIVTDYGADLALTSECYLLFVGLFFVFLYFECMCCLCSLRLISFSMIGQLFFFPFFFQ